MQSVYILSGARTPTGSFGKSLSRLTATQLGATAIKGAVQKAGLQPSDINEIYMGNVVSAGLGQAPARQATIMAGCPVTTEATTINKGLKAVTLASQALQLGQRDVMVAGGMESMSNAPFYFPRNASYGHQQALDAIIKDGLWDVYNNVHMGTCAEETAKEFNITREQQDAHAVMSYKRSAAAWEKGLFKNEIVPVTVKGRKGDVLVEKDEEYTNVDFSKVSKLKGAFAKDGKVFPNFFVEERTVTAANSSTLNDGASALVLATQAFTESKSLKPLARIVSMADAATHPKKFTIAPSIAIPMALKKAGLTVKDISLFEINEAFSVVILANEKILNLDPSKVNISGGGVSLGHPIGSSGSRILVSLIHSLKPGQLGVAAICNGGGAATAVVVERL